MADEIKKIVLVEIDLEQDQGSFAKLASYKTALAGIKDQQKELNNNLKLGRITQKEYSEEMVRLEAVQKKIAHSYNEVQRQVTGLKTPFQELNQTIKDHAAQVNVAGISLSTFAKPATATSGLLGGLFVAYKNSTIGAKDYEFVSNQLAATTRLLSNALFGLFSSAEDGEGALTKLFNSSVNFLAKFDTGTTGFLARGLKPFVDTAKQLTDKQEELQDLERELNQLKADGAARLEENADLQTKLTLEATTYAEKLAAIKKIDENITVTRNEQEANLRRQVAILQDAFDHDKANEKLEDSLISKKRELQDLSRKLNKLEEQNNRTQDNIVTAYNKQVEARRQLLSTWQDTSGQIKVPSKDELDKKLGEDIDRINKLNDAEIAAWESKLVILEDEKETTDKVTVSHKKNFEALSFISNALGGVAAVVTKNFKLSKAFASAQAAINSFLAGTYVLSENNPIKGPGARIAGMIAVIAAGLAQQVKILGTNIGSSGGGGGGATGTTIPTGTGRNFAGAGINFGGGIGTRVPGIVSIDAHTVTPVAGSSGGTGGGLVPFQDGVGNYSPVLVIEEVENKLLQRQQIRKRAIVSVNG